MFNLHNITNKNNKEHNKKWHYSSSFVQNFNNWQFWIRKKTNALLNLISQQDDIDKIYLYAKDLSEPKYEFLIKKHENVGKNIVMIQMHLLSVQIEWMTFIRILMITIQAEKEKF